MRAVLCRWSKAFPPLPRAPIAAPRVAPPGARLAPVVVEGEGLRPLDELQKPMPKLGESGFRLKPGQDFHHQPRRPMSQV